MISLFSLFYFFFVFFFVFFVFFFVFFFFKGNYFFFAVENSMGQATLVTFQLLSDVSLRML